MTTPWDPLAAANVQPIFTLIDDAQGRFVVERETGVIALSDKSWLEREPGAVHVARLRVVEPSGLTYELDVPLRLTGLVPLMEGAEALDCSGYPPDAPIAPLISLS